MTHRFFVLLYVLGIAGSILTALIFAFSDARFDLYSTDHYKVKCNDGSYVVLQGSPTDEPTDYSEREIESSDKSAHEKMWRFYCHYNDKIRTYIEMHRNATTNAEILAANQAYNAFERSVSATVPYAKNFTLEHTYTEKDPSRLYMPFVVFVWMLFIFFVLLQIVRMSYAYVKFGKVIWHPFKAQ